MKRFNTFDQVLHVLYTAINICISLYIIIIYFLKYDIVGGVYIQVIKRK